MSRNVLARTLGISKLTVVYAHNYVETQSEFHRMQIVLLEADCFIGSRLFYWRIIMNAIPYFMTFFRAIEYNVFIFLHNHFSLQIML